MQTRLVRWLQILVFTALLGASTALWAGRERVVAMLDGLSTSQSTPARTRTGRAREPAPVIVAKVDERADTVELMAIGTGRARRSVMIHPEVSGEIVEIAVEAGAWVSRGDALARLDDRKAQLALDIAETRLDDARRTLARAQRLQDRRVGSQATVDDAEIAVKRAELEREQAREILGDHTLSAPFEGVVGMARLEAGDRVEPTTPIFSLDDRHTLLVEFDAPELFVGRLSPALEVRAETPAFAGQSFAGKIASIDSRLDPVSRTIKVRAELDNTADKLRPGMSFTIMIGLTGATYPRVPELAVQWQDGASYVWTVNGNKVSKVTVEPVRRLNGMVLLTGAIKPGDLIVVEGVQRLSEGRTISLDDGLSTGGP